ncbi:hypothetical protein [Paenibacillus crassostreae]|uniref:Uncharacterized protein n=1 Tax=Paenibacillus crassostreae TaxID=1763538 RepID=A0A167C1R5_9BACL|nr:hypothetical protein [Paenibacillus crassostreae]AOZ91752.1 hypothetical protein LPB68_05640 [Paenibacillus crassostreae]OAB72675.1 hypothetical protein PNBC_14610 [Paenibacillus crassostreae]
MSRLSKKMWLIGIWTGLGILLGIQFANSNDSTISQLDQVVKPTATQEISLPVPQINPNPEVAGSYTITFDPIIVDAQQIKSLDREQIEAPSYIDATPQEILLPQNSESSVDKIADKTANLLQKASQKSIHFVVSLFNTITE